MWILFAPLLGCPATDTPDPPGTPTVDSAAPTDSTPPTDTDADTDTDSDTDSDTDTDTDTGPVEWQSLPNNCTPPTANGVDPFQLEGDLNLTQEPGSSGWFVELLDIAYLADADQVLAVGQGGLVVYAATGGTDPELEGHSGPDSSGSERYYNLLPADDATVWVSHRDKGLSLFSTADPKEPALVVEAPGSGFEGMAQAGSWLYVASTEGTVEVYDAQTPENLTHHRSVPGLDRPWDLHVVGSVAYVADGGRGVVALDLSDPGSPVIAGEADTEGIPIRLTSNGGEALYVASGAGGVEVYDISDPLAPVRMGAVDVGGGAQDVAVDGTLLGVATQEAVVLLDLADPLGPTPFAYQETEQYAMTLDAADGLWTVGDWNILGLWRAGTGLAPAIDPSLDTIAFLDGGETRELTITNRGAATLTLAGIELPDGVTGQVSRVAIEPGKQARLALSWEGTGNLVDKTACIASDDPGRPTVSLELTSGLSGEGKAVGQQAPDFTLQDLDGNTHRLSEQRGHPVVLAYFATW